MPRLYAIGDIHGHHTELMGLYQQLLDADMIPQRDTVVFLGDYVDGGSQAKQVIDQLIAWQQQYPHWVFLKGNHGDLMLDALCWNSRKYGSYDLWWMQGGRETAQSYVPTDVTPYERAIMQPTDYIPKEHLDWLASRPLTHETEHYLFVHAGFRPGVPLDRQTEEDMLWIRESFYKQRYNFGKPVVFGHTVFPEPFIAYDYRRGHKDELVAIGIDTMFHNQGKLTAAELDPDDPVVEPRFFFSPAVG